MITVMKATKRIGISILYLCTAAVILVIIAMYKKVGTISVHQKPLSRKASIYNSTEVLPGKKVILFWNDERKLLPFQPDQNVEIFQNCSVSDCLFTHNHSFVEHAAAILFLIPLADISVHKWPQKKNHQRWVFWTREPPCYINPFPSSQWHGLEHSINWTLTYKKNADIHAPYGIVVPRVKPLNRTFLDAAKRKSKLAFAMISHCKTGSERSSYIKLLRKYMPVDVYGSCGEKGKKNSTEYNSLFGKYKFYLAFENNFLKEYLTEKFFNTVDYDVVAVTRGGANYSDLRIKPEWHIDTQDFSSPKELAQYLLRLDKNDTLYAQHLLWKNFYQIPPGWSWTTNLLCTLCSKLHNTSEPVKWYTKQQLIQNFYKPWCQKPNDLPDH